MPALSSTLTLLLPILTTIPPTTAHSHLSHILINGLLYPGFDPRPNPPNPNRPSRVGWSTGATDDGFVSPANYSQPDIICHVNGAPPQAHAPVKGGDRVHVQWNGWPMGHVGPVLSYLAKCDGQRGCTDVQKEGLRWTKIDEGWPVFEIVEEGERNAEGMPFGVPGQKWATDVLIAANNSWQVGIPRGLKEGAYVLRNEIVALHYAAEKGGAQNYPLCINLWVGGDETGAEEEEKFELDGFYATEFYKEDDKGILVNVSAALTSYVVPGPTVAAGAAPVPYDQQQLSLSRAEGTPVLVTRSTETVPWAEGATPTPAKVKGRYYGRE